MERFEKILIAGMCMVMVVAVTGLFIDATTASRPKTETESSLTERNIFTRAVIEDHTYLIFKEGVGSSRSISVVHSESCNCKKQGL